jgi:ribonuclease D
VATVTIVSDAAAAQQLAVDLRGERALAVDCEASGGMHRFGRLCLLQIGTLDGRCYLIDPVASGGGTEVEAE